MPDTLQDLPRQHTRVPLQLYYYHLLFSSTAYCVFLGTRVEEAVSWKKKKKVDEGNAGQRNSG